MNGTYQDERRKYVRLAMRMAEQSGRNTTLADLAGEARVARSVIQQYITDDNDLFDGIVEEWFAPKLAIMDEVMASDLPVRRKMYEFFARRFILLRDQLQADPVAFKMYVEFGDQHIERARSFVDLADHYLCEIIAEAQAEGHFPGLSINETLSMINQMAACYILPVLIVQVGDRLSEAKLARIIDTMFDGLSAESRGASPVQGLTAA